MIIIVMGVSGCGKTSFAEALQEKLGWPMTEADDHHSAENKAKMGQGIPLNDQDRFPWLLTLAAVISGWKSCGQNGILTCSALKKMYRAILLTGRLEIGQNGPMKDNSVMFVHLYGPQEVICRRMVHRKGHFMPESLLNSQYHTLERPDPSLENAVELSVENSLSENIEQLCQILEASNSLSGKRTSTGKLTLQ